MIYNYIIRQNFYLFCILYKVTHSSTLVFTVTPNYSALWQNDLLRSELFFFNFFFLIMTVLLLPFLCHLPLGININAISKHDKKINLRGFFSKGCLQGPAYKVKHLLKDSSSDVIE